MEKIESYILIAPVQSDGTEWRAIVAPGMGYTEIQVWDSDHNGWVNADWLPVLGTDEDETVSRFEKWLSRRNGI